MSKVMAVRPQPDERATAFWQAFERLHTKMAQSEAFHPSAQVRVSIREFRNPDAGPHVHAVATVTRVTVVDATAKIGEF